MSLLVKVKKISLDGEEFYCVMDMKSIATYKRITGESFLKGIQSIGDMDEEVLLAIIASTLRLEPGAEPVGLEFLNKYNPIALVTEMLEVILELVEDALPKGQPGEVKKKKAAKK